MLMRWNGVENWMEMQRNCHSMLIFISSQQEVHKLFGLPHNSPFSHHCVPFRLSNSFSHSVQTIVSPLHLWHVTGVSRNQRPLLQIPPWKILSRWSSIPVELQWIYLIIYLVIFFMYASHWVTRKYYSPDKTICKTQSVWTLI